MTTLTADRDGISGDYDGLVTAYSNVPKPLTDDYTIELYDSTESGSPETLAADLGLYVDTESTYRLTIIQKDENYVLACAGSYKIAILGGFGRVSNITLENIKIEKTGQTANYQQTMEVTGVRAGDVIIKGCEFDGGDTIYRTRLFEFNHYATSATGTIYFYDNIIYNIGGGDSSASSIFYNDEVATQPIYIYNNTIDGGYYVFYATSDYSNCDFINNILLGVSGGFGTVTIGDGDYNTSDNTITSGGTNDLASQTLTFLDESGNDYHLTSGATGAIDKGIGPSLDSIVPTLDKDDVTRSGDDCDCGAYEYITSSGIPILRRRRTA